MLHSLVRSSSSAPARRHAILAALFVLVLAAEIFGLGFLQTTEYRLTDVFVRHHAAQYRPDPDIVVIDIDDASLKSMQESAGIWPWKRETHADLLEMMAMYAPRAVVFDIAFSERDHKLPQSDARLSDMVRKTPQTYLAATWEQQSHGVAPIPLSELSAAFAMRKSGTLDASMALQLPEAIDRIAWRLGLINSTKDDDGVLRRYSLYHDEKGWRLPSLPARVVGDMGIRLPEGAHFLMRWPHECNNHLHLSYGELFSRMADAIAKPEQAPGLDRVLRGKIIVIGSSATSTFDHHVTPINATYPGVDVLAVAIDNLKNARTVKDVAPYWVFAFGAALIVLLTLGFARRLNPAAVGLALALVSALALGVAATALGRDVRVPVATPLVFAWAWFILAAVTGYLRERRAREKAVSLFGRFLNPAVVRQIVDQGQTIESMSGRSSDITVLFSDIREFTSLSETRPPEEVVALLNRYFERQVDVVFRHGGTLDKFIGDCIMAFWGAPVDDPLHAQKAVAAALEMQEVMLSFRQDLAGGGEAFDFDIGIGVHTGPAVVGFIGAQKKLDYTAIGDTVNLASRVEGLTKGIARILVTRDTVLACARSDTLRFEPRGSFPVKGRAAAVELYEPRRIVE